MSLPVLQQKVTINPKKAVENRDKTRDPTLQLIYAYAYRSDSGLSFYRFSTARKAFCGVGAGNLETNV